MIMMIQGLLPFNYEIEKKPSGMTSLAGLPLYFDLAFALQFSESVARHLPDSENAQGWANRHHIMSLIMLNLAGGSAVDDICLLERDHGLTRFVQKLETWGLSRAERRAFEKKWRKEKKRSFPSPSSIFRFLKQFHDPEEEKKRQEHKAYIPKQNDKLKGLSEINKDYLAFKQRHHAMNQATVDSDATLIESNKKEALYCYKGFHAYQPLTMLWKEQDVVLYSEFRDGNVPAGYQQRRVLEAALEHLPEGVEKVAFRADSAGYEVDLLQYMAEGKNERFGAIKFGVSADVTDAFKKAVREVSPDEWHPLLKEIKGIIRDTGQEWAEVCYVPSWVGHKKEGPDYRYIAIREPFRQMILSDVEEKQLTLPFPTMEFANEGKYKLFGVVTNWLPEEKTGNELVLWHRERNGAGEKIHDEMKNAFAGGNLPTKYFGGNAAWWQLTCIAYNLNAIMKDLVLRQEGEQWVNRCLKSIRFHFITIPGRVIDHARQLIIRLSHEHPMSEAMVNARLRIMAMATGPPKQ